MSAIIKDILDDEGNIIYPVTKANAVYMNDNKYTVEEIIYDMIEGDEKIEFPSENTVKKTCHSGNIATTTFNNDGSIKTVTQDKEGRLLTTKVVTFADDGSIIIEVD